jgi:hypothetical protein
MSMTGKRFVLVELAGAAALFATLGPAAAATDHGVRLVLACENGRNYPIHPAAVSDEGDLVSGYIVVGPHRAIPIRLVPMGEGYRYAGRGIWFDGVDGDAELDWRAPGAAVPCKLDQG